MSKNNISLYVVATPIGNWDDITLRALKILKKVDIVVCENYKVGKKFLDYFDIKKDIIPLNVNNEDNETDTIFNKILLEQKTAALISDAGTPLFADPGTNLVKKCYENGLNVSPIPGASSLMASLMVLGEKIDPFIYYGFLSANKFERADELKKIRRMDNYNFVFLETPYRLKKVLQAMKKNLGGNRDAIIAYKLTQKEEKIFWGTIKELLIMTKNLPKGEFVLILKKRR